MNRLWIIIVLLLSFSIYCFASEDLIKADEAALKVYKETKELKAAIDVLENAGIKNFISEKPNEISKKKFISILNNYAFYLSETDRYEDAIPILNKVIEMMPDRAVVYLNLGDIYAKINEAKQNDELIDLIKKNYKIYVHLLKQDAIIPERVTKVLEIDLDQKNNIIPLEDSLMVVEDDKVQLYIIKKNNKYGYMDENGTEIIKPIFDEAENFTNGFANISIYGNDGSSNCKYGIIDKKGKIIINPKYDRPLNFEKQISSCCVNNKYGFVNIKGEEITPIIYDYAYNFKEGLASVKINKKWGYININGDYIIHPQYSEAQSFSDGLAPVKIGGVWGFIDVNNNLVITPNFDDAGNFHDGFARVKKGKNYYFIDKNGNTAFATKIRDVIEGFKDGRAKVSTVNGDKLMDTTGKLYDLVIEKDEFEVYQALQKNGVKKDEAIWLAPFLDRVDLDRNLFKIEIEDKIAYFDKNKNKIWGEINLDYEKDKYFNTIKPTSQEMSQGFGLNNLQINEKAKALMILKAEFQRIPEVSLISNNDHVYIVEISDVPRTSQGIYTMNTKEFQLVLIASGLSSSNNIINDKAGNKFCIVKTESLSHGEMSELVSLINMSNAKTDEIFNGYNYEYGEVDRQDKYSLENIKIEDINKDGTKDIVLEVTEVNKNKKSKKTKKTFVATYKGFKKI